MINRPSCDHLRRRLHALAVCCAALFMFHAATSAARATETLTEGSSNKQLRLQTLNSLPYHQLNQQTIDKIGDILQKPSIYRQLPVTSINADPDYFRFLVRYPEVIVNIWQLMGVTKMSTERTGPYSINTDDGAGTISSLELVYGTDNLHIFYGTGTYEGPILKRKLTGKCVLVLRTQNNVDATGLPTATNQLDVFLKIENATAGLIAKTIQPLVGSTADHNFIESLKFVERLNETTSKNGPGVQKMGEKLDIDAAIRNQFNQIVDVVFQRAINTGNSPEVRTPVPAQMNSYSVPGQPPMNLNQPGETQPYRPTNYPAPAYQQPNELGQSQPGYPARNGAAPARNGAAPARNGAAANYAGGQSPYPGAYGQSHQFANGYQMPARGYQAPGYGNPVAGNNGYPYQPRYGQPVQASYDYYGQQPAGNVQPAGGWRQR